MTPLGIGRIVIFALVSLFSGVVAGLSGYIVSLIAQFDPVDSDTAGFELFALACSVITVLVIAVVRLLDWTLRDSWLSRTAVELGWLGVLWVLWIGSAGWTTTLLAPLDLGNCADYYGQSATICSSGEAIEGLSWVNFLLLLTLFIWELAFAIIVQQRGNRRIWFDHPARYTMVSGRTDLATPAATTGGRYVSVGTQDYGMEQMRPYDAPFKPPMQGGQGQGQAQQGQAMYSQPQWGQPYTSYAQDPYASNNVPQGTYGPNPAQAAYGTPTPPAKQEQPRQQQPSFFGQPRTQSQPATPGQGQMYAQGIQPPPQGASQAQHPYTPRPQGMQQGYTGRAEV